MSLGHCSYVFNPSELYRRTKPGQGVETVCGAPTFPAVDEPEIAARPVRQAGHAEVTYQYIATGRMQPRGVADPYCPAHGGSPEPPPPPVEMWELQQAYAAYQQLAARFQDESGQPLATVASAAQIESPAPAAPVTSPVPAAAAGAAEPPELAAARAAYEQLAAQASEQGVSSNGS